LGTAPVAGYEGKNFLRWDVTTGNDYCRVLHNIESVRTFAGQTVTLSFWAKGTNPTTAGNLRVRLQQYFGTGGSPSANVSTAEPTFVLTANWTRYSFTFALASIAGKTIGTNNNDCLQVDIGQLGSTSTDAWTLDLWGVQLEAGSTVTAFQTATGNPASELAACQRYYYRFTNTTANPSYLGIGTYYSTTTCYIVLQWPVTMRIAPTIATSSQTGWLTQAGSQRNSTAFAVDVVSTGYADVYVTTSSHTLGIGAVVGLLGSSNHWVEASAEL
jgi:hypothetical protein